MLVTDKNKFIVFLVIILSFFFFDIMGAGKDTCTQQQGVLRSVLLNAGFITCIHAQEKININTATQQELETLPGIGPTKAQAIIDYREQNEPFEKIEDIMNVSGIGEATFNNIKDLISIQIDTDVNTNETQTNNENSNGTNDQNQATEITYSDKIVINEVLPNPEGSDDVEWIELKNLSSEDINLNNWQISDVTDKKYIISNQIIQAGSFLVLEKSQTKISLNNSGGEQIKLFWPDGTLINQINYIDDAKDNVSFARDENGNFIWTDTPTKNKQNIITVKDTDKIEKEKNDLGESQEDNKKSEAKNSEFKDKILITEFLPNPLGLDNNENEWIELYNTSTQDIILDGWKLKNNTSEYIFKNTKILTKKFLVLNRDTTGLILKNRGGDFLELYDNNQKLVDKISYTKNAPDEESYNFCQNQNKWLWLKEISLSQENKCPQVNKKPVAYFEVSKLEIKIGEEVLINADESYDMDGKIIKYIWQFENLVQEIDIQQKMLLFETDDPQFKFKFLSSGKQKITLFVFDELNGQDEFSQTFEVKISESQKQNWQKIIINEILPNPDGSDLTDEFIELYNRSNEDINLSGFKIDDGESGSTAYKIQTETMIPANGFLILDRQTTKIALNNDTDLVRLFNPDGNLIDEVVYDGVEVGSSYARTDDKNWQWTSAITKGEKNKLQVTSYELQVTKTNYYQNVSLEDITDLEKGNQVITNGIVAVEPGVLGANIFYISNENNFGGVQIYSYQKDFPALVLGDKVQIIGEISSYYNETRIKTKTKNDIKILSHENQLAPIEISLDEISEQITGSLIKIKGELTEIKGDYFWLDDNLSEIKVYVKNTTGINLETLDIAVLDKIEVIGVLSQTSSGFRVLPRYEDDIIITKQTTTNNNSPNIKGAKTTNRWRDYLMVTLAAMIIILIGLLVRRYKK